MQHREYVLKQACVRLRFYFMGELLSPLNALMARATLRTHLSQTALIGGAVLNLFFCAWVRHHADLIPAAF